jgi:hypothetical protein
LTALQRTRTIASKEAVHEQDREEVDRAGCRHLTPRLREARRNGGRGHRRTGIHRRPDRRAGDDVWQHRGSDGEIFLVIRDGVTADMQGDGDKIADEDIWHLVDYIRSLAR